MNGAIVDIPLKATINYYSENAVYAAAVVVLEFPPRIYGSSEYGCDNNKCVQCTHT